MLDPILDARMSALEQKLKCVTRRPSIWESQLGLAKLGIEEELWMGIDRTIGKRVQNHLKRISDLREDLRRTRLEEDNATSRSHVKVWRDYTEVYEQSQETFREWLDVLGGLVLRQKELDQNLCDVADLLIVRLARESSGTKTLSIPTAREALAATLARTIRLQFPERTIWDLPFTAHEYGHVVIDDLDQIRRLVEDTAARLVDQDLESNLVAGDKKEQAKERYEHHLEDFVADSYATHAMGPSFACAAIFLRFNPSKAYDETEQHVAYAKRAHLIFAILERMNDEVSGRNPYRDVIDTLKPWWEAMLGYVEPSLRLTKADEDRLEDLVSHIWNCFEEVFVDITLYPPEQRGNTGWLVAQNKSDSWNEKLKDPAEGLTDDNSMLESSNIRDLINAAWLSRIGLTKPNDPGTEFKINEVAKAAYGQCKKIVKASRGRFSGPSADGPSQPSPDR